MKDLILGIDIGTSSVKACVIDTTGGIVAQASHKHDLISRRLGWAEESASEWWQNTIRAIHDCLSHPEVQPQNIRSIGTTGMVPALVLLDSHGQVLRATIQQNDARAVDEITEFESAIGSEAFFQITGASLSQQSIGPKLVWLRRNEPDIWGKVSTVMGSYDYIGFCLTGELGIESNWALESGLYDINAGHWSQDLLDAFGIDRRILPAIKNPTQITGTVTSDAAAASGLLEGTPVAAGSADHVAAALAAGINKQGDLLVKFGSAGDILYCADKLVLEPRLYIDYHDIPGKFLLNGCMATSGSLLKWYVEQFCQADHEPAQREGAGSIYEYLDGKASQIPPGSQGVTVLPYFLGEKTPILDAHARGVFFGLTLLHNRYHLYRGVLEAVAFGFKHHVQVIIAHGLKINRITASEGGARSSLWRQITADVLGQPVSYIKNNPGASLAAAFVAGIGVGAFDGWGDIERFIEEGGITYPNPEANQTYEKRFEVYRTLYENTKELFKRI
ncbi:MAG: FGGY-family carbohydrate kinase [Anaerolineaceae bacterium]|nr:FGGY-family carbohydrate kinase [Anaerolineaceae bacterium]